MVTWDVRPISPVRFQDKEAYRTIPVASAQTFLKGAPLTFSAAANTVEEGGADPAAILGFATCGAADIDWMFDTFNTVVPSMPVALAGENVFRGTLLGTYDADVHVLGTEYGLVADGTSGYWVVDAADTTNTRVTLVGLERDVADGDVNIPVLFRVLPANVVEVSG